MRDTAVYVYLGTSHIFFVYGHTEIKMKTKYNKPGLVRVPLLLPVQDELDLAQALGQVDVLSLVERFHHGGNKLFGALALLELVEEPGHVERARSSPGWHSCSVFYARV